jgi:hypothetical protein
MGFLDDLPGLGFGSDEPPRPREKPRPAAEIDVVSWTRPRCPRCGSADCPVVDSHTIPVRWHECNNPACPARRDGKAFRFKSVETNFAAD